MADVEDKKSDGKFPKGRPNKKSTSEGVCVCRNSIIILFYELYHKFRVDMHIHGGIMSLPITACGHRHA